MDKEDYERLMHDETVGCYPEDCGEKLSDDTFTYYAYLSDSTIQENMNDGIASEEDNRPD